MLKKIMLTAWVALMLPAASYAAATKFYVPINRSEIVSTTQELSEAIVADPDIADIFVHGENRVSIIGRALGQTSVKLFDEDNNLVRELDVYVTHDLPAIRKALHEFMPFEPIGVEMVNTRVALTGEVSSAEAAASAIEIASQFIVASGGEEAADATASVPADEVLLAQTNSIINLMKIRAGQQVMLRIRFGEVKRDTIKALGAGLDVARTGGDLALNFLSSSNVTSFAAGTAATAKSISGTYEFGANTVTAALEALERDSLLKILAEPNLVAVSGEQAEFLSGGEVPIPVSQDDGQVSVEFRSFGVSLRFTPFVLSENRIRIQVEPEVSSRNDAEGIAISALNGGLVVPSFDVRRASTTVELAPGESFMIAGLLQDDLSSSVEQLPGISEIPIFSSLFRSTNYSREETELVIAVTPYLVDPLKSSDVRLPTDDFRPAGYMESFLYGALGSIQGNVRRISQTPTMEGPIGFMVD